MNAPLLQMKNITKFIYGTDGKPIKNSDVKILRSVNFELLAGEVHVLVGENGAGKSTLMKILGGLIPPDEGQIFLKGRAVEFHNARTARTNGIAFIHQELNLCSNLDIAHNIFLGREPTKHGFRDKETMYIKSKELLQSLSTDINPSTLVGRLSTAQQQIVEIAKALSYDSKIVIMDEPTASLTAREIAILFDLIRKMSSKGIGIIYISHRFEEFREIGDRLSVLRDGQYIGTLSMDEFKPDKVIQMMVGRTINEFFPSSHIPTDEVILRVIGLKLTSKTKPINIMVRKGEILGIGGLVGSGRTELAKSIFGIRDFEDGNVEYQGKNITRKKPYQLIDEGIAYLTEDRKQEGLISEMTIRENLTLSSLKKVSRVGLISPSREHETANRLTKELSIVARSIEQLVGTLSGGNQQRCVFGKWLNTDPKLLILDEPTRGIDINAKAEIHKIIDDIAASGVAVIMISSELPELIGMSDRIYIMRTGSVIAEVQKGPEMTQERIIEYICAGCP
ncbi:MAG: Galactose/methyl galactoside import ATP-binding protein MglA [Spirochaetes bacterium ADurb.Bin110]|nr:MAG: Galactose/methyl galactoside import ATP-binding protein MglA [Spirochaetes bacterium ADurb.Bin110]